MLMVVVTAIVVATAVVVVRAVVVRIEEEGEAKMQVAVVAMALETI